MILYIISQIFVGIGMLIDLASKTMKSKKLILLFTTMASLFYVLSYVCLQSPLSAIANSINLVRGIVYLYLGHKNLSFKYYLIPMFLLTSCMTIAIAFYWSDPKDLFVFSATILVLIALAFKNTLIIRLGFATAGCLWLYYNFSLHGYVNMTCDILNLTVVLSAVVYYNIILPRREKLCSDKFKEFEKTTNQILAIIKSKEKTV